MVPTNGAVHKIEASWDQFASGDLPAVSPARQLFIETVLRVAAQASAAMPECNGRVERARALLLAGLVERQADYSFVVRSSTKGQPPYLVDVDGHCSCPDATKRQQGRCKHLIATWLWRRSRQVIAAQQAEPETDAAPALNGPPPAPVSPPPVEPLVTAPEVTPPTSLVPAWALVELHGRQFITFGGLLAMAHERGLQSLAAQFITVTPELALAEATATFADGRTYTEAADATPQNVNKRVALHFARVALTRSKARCLRDALNIPLVCVEELES